MNRDIKWVEPESMKDITGEEIVDIIAWYIKEWKIPDQPWVIGVESKEERDEMLENWEVDEDYYDAMAISNLNYYMNTASKYDWYDMLWYYCWVRSKI